MKSALTVNMGGGMSLRQVAACFYDLGFDEAEARVLEMRADLIAALREPHRETGLDAKRGGQEASGPRSREVSAPATQSR